MVQFCWFVVTRCYLNIVFTVNAKHCTTKITPSYELAEVVSTESTKTNPEKNIYTDRKSFTCHEI